MKKTMVTIFILALLLGALTGCGARRNNNATTTPDVTTSPDLVKPNGNTGVVEENNGIVEDNNTNHNSTDTDVPNEGVLPEIGAGIEEGTNDIIDGVEDAIDGGNRVDNNNTTNNGEINGSASHGRRVR